ncbi:MAG: dTDP-4-amino-4,6-dideoxygalactose transaminase [Cyclobacteriaceae bacterium]
MKIPFNKPYLTGGEMEYILDAVRGGKISGNGIYTEKCHDFFCSKYGFPKTLLTTSCTDALEMCSLLLNISHGDEVIVPAFTFVSSANAFVLRGANIKFADSYPDNPNINPAEIERLISDNTRAIVVVHYAGVACDMDAILEISKKYNIPVIEDAAQAINSFYKGTPLGSLGALSTFSFHETKNIISGEGGMLVVNDSTLSSRAEIIWEKGTNRTAMKRGDVDKYGWVDVGSSFLPSEIIAAFLLAQLENLEDIQARRIEIWNQYNSAFKDLKQSGNVRLPEVPDYATNNGHLFYLVCENENVRNRLIVHLKNKGILAVFHYLSLNQSPYYLNHFEKEELKNSESFERNLIRLPLFYELSQKDQNLIIDETHAFFD